MIQSFNLYETRQTDDGMGGYSEKLKLYTTIRGYLDLSTGSNRNFNREIAIVEESTHVLILPQYRDDLNNRMIVEDGQGKKYRITHIDDPVGVKHHLEIYLEGGR